MIGRHHSALGLLRLLLLAAILAPVLLTVVLGWRTYRAALAEAQQENVWTSGIAREHAMRVFDAQELVIDRVFDLLGSKDDAAVAASEAELHEALKNIMVGFPQFLSILVIDREGRPLVASGAYSTPKGASMADRDYFLALSGGADSFVSRIQMSRIDGRVFFGLARARRDGQGQFIGLVNVAISPALFSDFYRSIIDQSDGGSAGHVLTMLRDDGEILVRWPPLPTDTPPPAATARPFLEAVTAHPGNGRFRSRSAVDPGAPDKLHAYWKVGTYPLYVVSARSVSAVAAAWRRQMLRYLAAIVPAAVVLVLLTLETVRLARREREALGQARAEISRREVAEEALRRSQRLEAVGQLTGGIAHDFNNLLTIIVGNVDMMVRRASDAERVRRLGGNVLAAAKRVADVTDKLLAFSRRHAVRPEVISADRLLEELNPLLRRAINEAVEIDYRIEGGLCRVRVDAGQLEAALINLVVNARDAMPSGGRLLVSLATQRLAPGAFEDAPDLPGGDYLHIAVADTGLGMTAATLARAFEPFFTTKDVGKGTGLGLSQVYGFAKQAGGHVVLSSAVGSGTRVDILLPCAAADPEPETIPVTASPPARAQRLGRVLVVEDEAGLRDMAVESLEDLGYRTLAAADAGVALAMLDSPETIDVLFSDIVMPGAMDGIALVREARRRRPGLPVLLTSGYIGREGDSIPEGVRLLRKPYLREDLASEVARLMGQTADT